VCLGFLLGSGLYVGDASAQPSLLIVSQDGEDTPHSYATSISGDGRTVAGFVIGSPGIRAFRWDADSGLVLLEPATQDSNEQGTPFALSADGSVVVGFSAIAGFPSAVMWDDLGAVAELGTLGIDPDSNLDYSSVYACDATGTVLVGITSSPDGQEAFRWTEGTGLVGLGGLASTAPYRSEAVGISTETGAILGESLDDDSKSRLFRWTEIDGMVELERAGFDELSVNDASPGATAMTGGARTGPDERPVAFVWHEDAGVTDIPLPPESNTAFGFGVSDDGASVVGRYEPAPTAPGTSGFFWTPTLGTVDFNDYCVSTLGIDPGDWILYPEDMDASGGVIVGAARLHPNGSQFALAEAAFVLDLDLPCPADLTGEGDVNFFDLVEFITRFNANDPRADLDTNGVLNFFDIAAYLGLFSDCV